MELPEKSQLNDKPIKSDREGYFKLVISDLEPDKVYPIQFRWYYKDGTFGPWSNIKVIVTPEEGVLNAPEFLNENLTSDEENIFVEWSGNDENGDPYPNNFKHIEIHYRPDEDTAYKIFGTKITKAKEKITIPAKLDKTYYVKLRAISTSDLESPFSDIQDVLVESTPNNPPSNLNVAWSTTGSNLIFTFTHDTSLPVNKTTKEYYVDMVHPVYGSHRDIIEVNTSSSQQKGSFTREENIGRYGFPLATSLSGTLCAVNAKNKQSTKINWSAPAKISTLPSPTITVSKGKGFYQVAWVKPVDDSLSTIVVEESSSSFGPWTEVAISTNNPVVIQSNSSTKYVRAIFYDFDNLPGQGYSSVHSVTPDAVVVEDETTPAAPGSVSVSANTLSSSELKNGVGSITVTWTITDLSTYSKHGGVNIEYKLSTDSGYNSIFVPFTTSSPKYTHKIEGLIQGLSYNFRVSSLNGNTLKQSSFTTSSPSAISVLSSTSISQPKTPEVFVGLDSTNTNPGPMTVRVRQYSQKSNNTDIEKDISHFEIWAIPSTYSSANDSVAQRLGTIKAAASGGNMNYVEGNFTVNVQANTNYKFYSKAVNNGGYSSVASALSEAKTIPFIPNAYISDLSADKITTGTLAATQYITVGTSSNSIKINSASSDTDTYIRSGTGGYNNTSSGFYVDASGRFSLKDQLTFDGNNLTVKGAITARSGVIETGNLQVTTGTIIAGTPGGNRVVMNSEGISAHLNGVEHTYIKNSTSTQGAPFYTTNAKIGNWTVDTNKIYAGQISLDSSAKVISVSNNSNTFYVGMGEADANGIIFWAGGSPSNRLNNVKFYIKGDGSVFIASGVQIGGYAKTSDIPDTSTFAKTDMSNVTTIDGGLIKTGVIKSQNHSGVIDGSTFSLDGTAINLSSSNPSITSKNFRIDTTGTLYLRGDIQADTGRLGGSDGWSISSNQISSSDGNTYLNNPKSTDASTKKVLKIGDTFDVDKSGKLSATSVDISGVIKATTGYIGGENSGWAIGPNLISSGNVFLNSSTGVVSGAKIQGGSIEITGGFLLGDDGTDGVISSAFTTLYSRKMPVTSPDYPIRNPISSLGLNAIAFISQDSGGWVSHSYPYWGGAADLGVSKYWWRHGRFGGNVHIGYAGSNTLPNTSTSVGDAANQSKIFLDKDGPIYANTLGTVTNTTTQVQGSLWQSTSGYIKVFLNTSSNKYKENINSYSSVNYENIINGMRIVTFNYKPEYTENPEELNLGLIAEEVAAVEPSEFLVGYKDGEPDKVYYSNLPLYILGAVQEISTKIKSLEQRLDALEA